MYVFKQIKFEIDTKKKLVFKMGTMNLQFSNISRQWRRTCTLGGLLELPKNINGQLLK